MPICPFRQSVPFSAEKLDSVCPVGCQSCCPVPQGCPGDQCLAGSTLPCLLTDRSPLQSWRAAHSHEGNCVGILSSRGSGAGADVFSKVPLSLGASGSLRTLELSGRDILQQQVLGALCFPLLSDL